MSLDSARKRVRLLRAYDAREVSLESAVNTGPETVVQQHFADEVDINTIVRRFGISQAAPLGVPGGLYGDFTGITDFESAVAAVERAEAGFMKLPADVRERFFNDPGRLIAHAQSMPPEALEADLFPPKVAPPAPPVAPPAAPVVPPAGGSP